VDHFVCNAQIVWSYMLNVIVKLYTTLSKNFDLLTELYLTCTTLDTLHLVFIPTASPLSLMYYLRYIDSNSISSSLTTLKFCAVGYGFWVQ